VILILVSILLGVAAISVLVLTATGSRHSERLRSRLSSLDLALAPIPGEETIADLRRAPEKLSGIPWLNQLLTRMNLAPAFSLMVYQAGMTVSLGTLILISLGGMLALGAALYLKLGPTLPAALLSTLFLPLPFLYVRMRRGRRLLKLEQQLPEALDTMASALRVGHSLIASIGAVAQDSQEPMSGEMRKCFEEQNYGVDLRTALVNLTNRAPIQDFRIFVAAVLIQKESGGNLAEVLDKVSQTTRERFRLKKQVMVHTAQGRMTGWILALLPVLLGGGMYLMNPDSMSVLWKRPVGQHLLYAALAMETTGALLIRKIVAIRV
jgi:tight adherence protein B